MRALPGIPSGGVEVKGKGLMETYFLDWDMDNKPDLDMGTQPDLDAGLKLPGEGAKTAAAHHG